MAKAMHRGHLFSCTYSFLATAADVGYAPKGVHVGVPPAYIYAYLSSQGDPPSVTAWAGFLSFIFTLLKK